MLCAVQIPGEPVLTTAAACGTAVRSSLGSAGLPQWSKTQAYTSNIYLLSPVSSSSSRQTQGVMGVALNRWHELQVRCAASASRSSAEAASLVLSTSPESWIARVGRANSSTRQKFSCFALKKPTLLQAHFVLTKVTLFEGKRNGTPPVLQRTLEL